ncbi:hypothetical protein HK405_012126, partial [Cladochytrium tenue]
MPLITAIAAVAERLFSRQLAAAAASAIQSSAPITPPTAPTTLQATPPRRPSSRRRRTVSAGGQPPPDGRSASIAGGASNGAASAVGAAAIDAALRETLVVLLGKLTLPLFRTEPPIAGAPVEYYAILDSPVCTMGLLVLKRGQTLPTHDHPGMSVFSKVVHGHLHVAAYEFVDADDDDDNVELNCGCDSSSRGDTCDFDRTSEYADDEDDRDARRGRLRRGQPPLSPLQIQQLPHQTQQLFPQPRTRNHHHNYNHTNNHRRRHNAVGSSKDHMTAAPHHAAKRTHSPSLGPRTSSSPLPYTPSTTSATSVEFPAVATAAGPYTTLCGHPACPTRGRRARLALNRVVSADAPGDGSLLCIRPDSGPSLHSFTAASDVVVILDLLGPPYHDQLRPCTYFADPLPLLPTGTLSDTPLLPPPLPPAPPDPDDNRGEGVRKERSRSAAAAGRRRNGRSRRRSRRAPGQPPQLSALDINDPAPPPLVTVAAASPDSFSSAPSSTPPSSAASTASSSSSASPEGHHLLEIVPVPGSTKLPRTLRPSVASASCRCLARPPHPTSPASAPGATTDAAATRVPPPFPEGTTVFLPLRQPARRSAADTIAAPDATATADTDSEYDADAGLHVIGRPYGGPRVDPRDLARARAAPDAAIVRLGRGVAAVWDAVVEARAANAAAAAAAADATAAAGTAEPDAAAQTSGASESSSRWWDAETAGVGAAAAVRGPCAAAGLASGARRVEEPQT